MRFLIIIAALCLSGCGDFPRPRTDEEIRDIAEDVADAVVSDRAPNASDTEDRLDDLEKKLRSVELENEALNADIASLRAELEAHRHISY